MTDAERRVYMREYKKKIIQTHILIDANSALKIMAAKLRKPKYIVLSELILEAQKRLK